MERALLKSGTLMLKMCMATNFAVAEPQKSVQTSRSCSSFGAEFGLRFAYNHLAGLDRNSRAGVDRKPGEQRFCFNATRANGTAFSDRTGPFCPPIAKKNQAFQQVTVECNGFYLINV
jgi:hypothetical protein